MTRVRRRQFLIAAGALLAAPIAGFAQSRYPVKPIRVIVPFPPGGPTDVFARQYAVRLAAVLGQPVVIDNKSGAGGAIGAVEVKKSEPDGYVLLFGSASNLGLYNLMSSAPLYDALKDFVHVASLGGAPAVFAVNPSMPQTLKGVIEAARAKPGSIQYGSPGQGTYLHLAGERLKLEAGNIDIQHIPFRGSSQTIAALLGGQVGMTVETLGTALAGHRAGTLRIVAVASPRRSPLLPEVPTVDEAIATKGFEAVLWNVVAAPTGTPAAIIDALAAATGRVLADPSLNEQLGKLGIQPTTESSPAAATSYIRTEIEKWRPVVEASGVKIQ
ncbi:MAG: tripartite tricarboxylate transporter substrate-binding protein [Proteobacteria bacterium]|nr:tripartite tricarboxylate transporter substrate-binding protein [Pseudomonadota bacterium]